MIEHWHCFEAVCSTFFLFVGLAFGMIGNYALSGFVLKDLNDFKSHQKIKIWLILYKVPLCYFCFFNYFYYPKSKSFDLYACNVRTYLMQVNRFTKSIWLKKLKYHKSTNIVLTLPSNSKKKNYI